MPAVTVTIRDHVAQLRLDPAPANAFDTAMYRELLAAFESIDADPDVRVTIIGAEGRFFSAGNDVNEFASAAADRPIATPGGALVDAALVDTALGVVARSPKPVIALVQGIACGAGFCVAAYADIVIATPDARFGIPEVRVGVVGGAPEASACLPPKVTRYLALTGDLIDADDAYRAGFVSRIVPPERLRETGVEVARRIVRNPPLTVLAVKESLANIYPPDRIARLIDDDAARLRAGLETADHREAVQAFLEKREPRFEGR